MRTTVPFSTMQRSQTEVTALLDAGDVVLDRRDAGDLYLSTLSRHEDLEELLNLSVGFLADVATARPDVAGYHLVKLLPWYRWLSSDDQTACLTELLDELRAAAATEEAGPFLRAREAWKETAIIYSNPALVAILNRDTSGDDLSDDERVVEVAQD